MADKAAKVHTHISNRERPRKATTQDRKVVFKSVLENPFRIRWPSVPINLQNVIFSYLLSLLEGAAAYHEAQCLASRKRKRGSGSEAPRKKSQKSKFTGDVEMEEASIAASEVSQQDNTLPSKPDVLNHLTLGINAVTKRLEAQARQVRRTAISPTGATDPKPEPPTPISIVFVCRADVDPPSLIDHLPPLIAACNSVHTKQHIKIVPFPKDSENILAEKLGIRRASVIALDAQYAGLAELHSRLESIAPLAAPWLMMQAKAAPSQLVPTHVKQLRTSAPKDMNAAKQARLAGRAAAQAKKQKQSQDAQPSGPVT